MPALTGVGQPDRLAVLDDVGKDHDLRQARLRIGVGDIDLQLPEARTEVH